MEQRAVWGVGEFLADARIDGLRVLNPGIAGLEFLHMNRRGNGVREIHNLEHLFCRTPGIHGTGGVRGAAGRERRREPRRQRHPRAPPPGHRLELIVKNATFVNFEAPLWTRSWCVGMGGYEVDLKMLLTNVTRPATFKKGFGGTSRRPHLNDRTEA